MRIASGLLCCVTFVVFAQDTPPSQPPAQTQPPPAQAQQPPSAPGTPAAVKPKVELPPVPAGQPSKAPPAERDTEGDAISIMPFYWQNTGQPNLRKVNTSAATQAGSLDFNGDKKYAYGGVVTVPTGHENSLQFTYFRKLSSGNSTIGVDQSYFGNVFTAGDVISTHYTLQAFKLSWNYLTYPYPSSQAKFRLKTLYEVQYVSVRAAFDAPADVNAIPTLGSKSVILPTLGAGMEYHFFKNVLFELKGSGFGIPHHADIWDTEANLIVRSGRLELVVGGKAFHFKDSPHGDNFFSDTLYGPYGGLRYIFK